MTSNNLEPAYIFLDVDNVLNSTRTLIAFGDYTETSLDPVAIGLLNTLCSELAKHKLDPRIVISSSWRIAYPAVAWWQTLLSKNAHTKVVGVTPNSGGRWTRGYECERYLRDNKHPKDTKWVVIDDKPVGVDLENWVHVKDGYGLSLEDIDNAFEILTGRSLLPAGLSEVGKWTALKMWSRRK